MSFLRGFLGAMLWCSFAVWIVRAAIFSVKRFKPFLQVLKMARMESTHHFYYLNLV